MMGFTETGLAPGPGIGMPVIATMVTSLIGRNRDSGFILQNHNIELQFFFLFADVLQLSNSSPGSSAEKVRTAEQVKRSYDFIIIGKIEFIIKSEIKLKNNLQEEDLQEL